MKKTLLDDIVSHIAESVVQRFVKSRKVKEASQQEARGKEPVSIEVLDDFHLDSQAVHQQAASFRISESDPLGEFSMFRFSVISMLSKQHYLCMFSNHLSLEVPPLHHLHAQVHCSGCSVPTPGPITPSAAPQRKVGRISPLFSHRWLPRGWIFLFTSRHFFFRG